jgi:hypothetical protein
MVFPDINCPHRTKADWFKYMKPEEAQFRDRVHKKSMVPLDELHHYFDPVSMNELDIQCVLEF